MNGFNYIHLKIIYIIEYIMFKSSYIPEYVSLKQLNQLKTYNIAILEEIHNKKENYYYKFIENKCIML